MIIKFIALLVIVTGIAACGNVKEKADSLVEDTKNSYDSAVDEVISIKDKTVETVDDVNNAIDKVKEAKEAIDEVTN